MRNRLSIEMFESVMLDDGPIYIALNDEFLHNVQSIN